jgi:hypothetical protein
MSHRIATVPHRDPGSEATAEFWAKHDVWRNYTGRFLFGSASSRNHFPAASRNSRADDHRQRIAGRKRQCGVWESETRSAKIAKAVLSRVLFYGSILLCAWWWMLWTPGRASVGPLQPLNADELRLEGQLRDDVEMLAADIGERNVAGKPKKLEEAAQFIESSLRTAGYQPQSQW